MRFIYNLVKDYGAAIIIFTLFTKLIMFPFTYKQQISSERMRSLNPKLQKIRKAYANNPQKMQEEQTKLYQDEHISMSAGCLPMLFQTLLIFGVLDVVYRPLSHILRIGDKTISEAKAIASPFVSFTKGNDMRQELKIMEAIREHSGAFSEKMGSLVEKVAGFNNELFGFVDLTGQPTLKPDNWNRETIVLAMIPFVAGFFQLVSVVYSLWRQKKTNPSQPSMGIMNIILCLMPIFSVFFSFAVPAGVGFYWAVSALTSWIIQVCLHKYLTPARVEVILAKEKEKNAKKKPGMLQRAMMAQQQQMAELNARSRAFSEEESKLSRKELNELNNKRLEEARKRLLDKYGDDK
jgi:YidC/Oxa1 family membrane protein insertase